jgi:hypothetical protein
MAGVDAARPARDGVYSMSVNGRNDGSYLVYQHVEGSSDDHVALYVVNVDGPAHRRRITGADGSYMSFGWVR